MMGYDVRRGRSEARPVAMRHQNFQVALISPEELRGGACDGQRFGGQE